VTSPKDGGSIPPTSTQSNLDANLDATGSFDTTKPETSRHRLGRLTVAPCRADAPSVDKPRYAYVQNASGLNVSYLTLGRGSQDIVWMPNFTGRMDAAWLNPILQRFLRRLASIGRLLSFDTSGTGGSDPIPPDQLPTMEQWMDDIRAVMDAEGSERATLFAMDSAGALAMVFAATHPDRVQRLVLANSYARLASDHDYPLGFPLEAQRAGVEWWLKRWGTGTQLELTAPSIAGDESYRDWMGFVERSSAPRRMWRAIFEMIGSIDVRHVLPAIRVPTLVIHRAGDRWIPAALGRFVADSIAGARFVEVPGEDHYPWLGDTEPIFAEVRPFVTGPNVLAFDEDRALATLLFTDIVGSTARAAEIGDARWRDLLDRHDDGVRIALDRFRGREIKTTGDGFLASFDGPARAVRCALAIAAFARDLGIEVRAGLHTGEVELRGDDIAGLSVALASRVAALAGPGQVLTSQTVKDLTIGSGLGFDDRGMHTLKGVPGEWRVFEASSSGTR